MRPSGSELPTPRLTTIASSALAACEASRRAEERSRTILENSADQLLLLEAVRDNGGTVVAWRYVAVNEATRKTLELVRAALIGKTVGEIFPDVLAALHER